MYPDRPKEDRALEALEHPDGEEYPGANDCYRDDLIESGWSEGEVERRFGKKYEGFSTYP